ncbi:MAG: 16S rRNA processing protein RimM [Prevotella sp.]|nr:16S rRNA processing protein RimM [Prevotella sp.]
MIKEEDVFKIGRLGKPHGVKGEVTMQVDDDVFDRVDADFLVLWVDGILVPFFIEEYRFKTDTTALIKFEDVDTVEGARELTNSDVFFPRNLADNGDEDYTWSFFMGFELADADSGNIVGRIASVDDSTANVLFCLEDGRLIPAIDDLVANIDVKGHRITMRLPDGLLGL